MFHRQSRTQILIALGLLLLGVVLLLARWPRRTQTPEGSPLRPRQTNRAGRPTPAATANHAQRTYSADRLAAYLASLRTARNPEDARNILASLKGYLASLPPEMASATIREFLDTHQDAPTQLDFVVGPDGFLKEPPALRVFLLDYLAQVDRPAAAAYAQKILATMNSPDEWAVSLRNYALVHTNSEAKAFLQAKVLEMITHEPWQQHPSTGFLEAFDVAVYAGGTALAPELSGLLRQTENRAVAHAAYLALDRLVLQEPGALLRLLEDQPGLMSGREQTRANYLARANVADPEQKQLLEDYLLDSRLTGEELEAFAGAFPNANYMISNNLLTRTVTPTREALVRHDRQALQVVEAWLTYPRFARIKPQLERVRNRLADFVRQAGGLP